MRKRIHKITLTVIITVAFIISFIITQVVIPTSYVALKVIVTAFITVVYMIGIFIVNERNDEETVHSKTISLSFEDEDSDDYSVDYSVGSYTDDDLIALMVILQNNMRGGD